MPTNWKHIKAIEAKNKQQIQELCPMMHDVSGIYILTRYESGFKYAYVGQAKHLLTRLAQHLSGYQHIDLSLKNTNCGMRATRRGGALILCIAPKNGSTR